MAYNATNINHIGSQISPDLIFRPVTFLGLNSLENVIIWS